MPLLKMLLKLFLLLANLEMASASYGFTSAGTLFTMFLPSNHQKMDNTAAILNMMTEHRQVNVTIFQRHAGHEEAFSYSLKRYEKKTKIMAYRQDGGVFFTSGIDLYIAFRIEASAAIRAIVQRYMSMALGQGTYDTPYHSSHILIPEKSCFNSYSVSLPPHNVASNVSSFLAVLSFRSKMTEVNIDIPDAQFTLAPPHDDRPLYFRCHDEQCYNATTRLGPHQAWYHKTYEKYFRNILVKADKPVYVVAGSLPHLKTGGFVMNVNPTQTWGKVYVTPTFTKSSSSIFISTGSSSSSSSSSSQQFTLILTFTIGQVPFDYSLFDGDNTDPSPRTIKNFNDCEVPVKRTSTHEKPYIISSKVPFGLYFHHQLTDQSGKIHPYWEPTSTNLIAVEHWGNGAVLQYPEIAGHVTMHFVVLSTAERKNVLISTNNNPNDKGCGNTINETHSEWADATLNYMGRKYSFLTVSMNKSCPTVTIYTTEPSGRLIVYMALKNGVNQSYQHPGHAIFTPIDYNCGSINDDAKSCATTIPILNDGTDNDCDGLVDEELKNRRDDDGDGRVDEDTLELPGDSEWAPWINAICRHSCRGNNDSAEELYGTMDIRTCNTKRFGKDCPGDDTRTTAIDPSADNDYDPINGYCPSNFASKYSKWQCDCNPGCAKGCGELTYRVREDARCWQCKPNYYEERFCLRRCPFGWRGRGCSEAILHRSLEFFRTDDDDDANGNGNNNYRHRHGHGHEKKEKEKEDDHVGVGGAGAGEGLKFVAAVACVLVPLSAIVGVIVSLCYFLPIRRRAWGKVNIRATVTDYEGKHEL